jgi:hypothetical protein
MLTPLDLTSFKNRSRRLLMLQGLRRAGGTFRIVRKTACFRRRASRTYHPYNTLIRRPIAARPSAKQSIPPGHAQLNVFTRFFFDICTPDDDSCHCPPQIRQLVPQVTVKSRWPFPSGVLYRVSHRKAHASSRTINRRENRKWVRPILGKPHVQYSNGKGSSSRYERHILSLSLSDGTDVDLLPPFRE